MIITGPPNPLSCGGQYSLDCMVISDLTPTVQWLDPNSQMINTSGTSVRTGNPVTSGNTIRLMLHFDPTYTSHGGTYTCISRVSETGSFRRQTRHIQVQSELPEYSSVIMIKMPSTILLFMQHS